jgi:nucleotide-binding universal stress UspA family protein
MIKKILIAHDGSAHGEAALSYGLWLAESFGAGVIGIHVVDVVALEGPFLHDISGSLGFEPLLNFTGRVREALEGKGRDVMASLKDACLARGVEAEPFVTTGIVVNEICEKARSADIVVLGRRGVNVRFEYGLLGSTTEGVLRKSPRPVLAVPDGFRAPRSPLLAYDGSPSASKAMQSAAEWAKTLKLPLSVVTVSKAGDDRALTEAEGYLAPYGIDVRFALLAEEPARGPAQMIEKYYDEKGHDLLFMGATHHTRLVEMVIGSTTEHVMRKVPGPFFLQR